MRVGAGQPVRREQQTTVMTNTTPIRAIPTRYAGRLFRSRTEARWAVFFDELGVEWEYEVQGFETSHGRYLPDFYLPKLGVHGSAPGTWFEVKNDDYWSNGPDTELDKWLEVARGTEKSFVLAYGIDLPRPDIYPLEPPRDGFRFGWGYGGEKSKNLLAWGFHPSRLDDDSLFRWCGEDPTPFYEDDPVMFCVCPDCGRVGIEWWGCFTRVCQASPVGGDHDAGLLHDRVLAAYEAGISARFEFGDSGSMLQRRVHRAP